MELDTPFRTLLAKMGLELYDVEIRSGVLNVTVTKPGGIDLESLTAANRALSTWLDENDPIPGRYTLDVSSPGLERRLRTPDHFASAKDETVTLRELRDDEPTRRLEGVVTDVSATSVTLRDLEHGDVTVLFANIERARTVFEWGATAKPTPSKGRQNTATTSRGR